jgi:peptide/nickel transport system ATP-binding protein
MSHLKRTSEKPDNHFQETLLQVKELAVQYRTERLSIKAVSNVSFDLEAGQTLGIVGESGSGKTSVALALMGLITEPHQLSGQVIFQGINLLSLPEEQQKSYRWSQLALVFQNALEVLNPVLTVNEQVSEPLKRHLALSGNELTRKVKELFAQVGLDYAWRNAYPHQLSGGMRQRVLLAMALSCSPQVLIVDEPTSSLDAIARKELLDLLKELQKKHNFAMILISHDLSAMQRLSERLLVIYAGEIVESGPTVQLIERPLHPYTRGLIGSAVEVFPYKDLWGIPGECAEDRQRDRCAFADRCTQKVDVCTQSKPELTKLNAERAVSCHRGGIAAILEGKSLSKAFKINGMRIKALQNVNIKLYHGETAALVGVSGSGKSTLAHVLSGLFRSDQGQILYRGQVVEGSFFARVEQGIQLVLQDPFSSVSHRLKVSDAVLEPLVINKIGSHSERQQKLNQVLQAVRLPVAESFLERYCHSLSGGQRQRLAIARALIMKPSILIADEITSMLDVSTQANLLRLLKSLQNEQGFTMLYITHDLPLARKIAERIIVLHEGMVVEEGSAGRVSEHTCCVHTRGLFKAGLKSTERR